MNELLELQVQHQTLIVLWRELGGDYARFKLNPPDLPSRYADYFMEGFRAERHLRGDGGEPHDRFVRKWLQLRLNALKRERRVAKDFTLEAVRRMDVEVCPVTLTKLTHGSACEDTNWSIDRLNNDFAYAMGNVAVMSTRANKAKGTKTLADVRELSHAAAPCEGLTPTEWARLEALMFGPCVKGGAEDYYVRQVAPLYGWVLRNTHQEWQDFFTKIAVHATAEERAKLYWGISDGTIKGAVQRIVQSIVRAIPLLPSPYDVWFDEEMEDRLSEVYAVLVSKGIDIQTMLRPLYPAFGGDGVLEADLAFESRGYLFAAPSDPAARSRFLKARRTLH